MQQIYRRTPVPKSNLNEVALQLYLSRTSVWLFSCKFAAYFQNTFSMEHLWVAASEWNRLFKLNRYKVFTKKKKKIENIENSLVRCCRSC